MTCGACCAAAAGRSSAGRGGETVTVRPGSPTVTLTGRPSELLLYGFGRGANAQVDVDGDDAAVGRLATTRFGL